MVQNVQNLSDRPSHVTLPLEYWTLKVSGIQMSGILMYRTYVYVKIIIFSTLILNIKMNYQMNNIFFGVIQSDAKINQFFGEFVHEKFFCHLVLKSKQLLTFPVSDLQIQQKVLSTRSLVSSSYQGDSIIFHKGNFL